MKKVIFCFDGTSNDPTDSQDFFTDTSISNVLKLYCFLGGILPKGTSSKIDTSIQESFYYSGVGTRGNWFIQKFNTWFAPPYGDMSDIIADANEDLNNIDENDIEIYIFGFSRGAAIARRFASQLNPKYRVKFLGVFDTVAATRGSLDLKSDTYPASGVVFENGTLGEHVEKAVHLVSIDEKRIAFQPTLFNKDDRVLEVWFSGVHSDIGGGYWFDALSDITLQFMCDYVSSQLKLLSIDEIEYNKLKVDDETNICKDDLEILPFISGKMHEQQRVGVSKNLLAPRLVRVNINDHPSSTDYPIIHHSVIDRFFEVKSYRPYALRDTRFKVLDKNNDISEEVYHGINGFRSLKSSESFK
ncbi:DUF2235 domain-containing protein [Halarcobacter sp.]|uniref:DUF2235 domain-containing protein n=1 Tax=Halarcobacter sp. TaxID=2321133 RepID=UPI002AA77CB4|nr:DUF2235 domain-containing protein [Halarcobacter sp.]